MGEKAQRWTASDYERAAPALREHVRRFQQALDAVRSTHRGRPVDEVRRALTTAVEQEGLKAWNDVLADAAFLISTEADLRVLCSTRTGELELTGTRVALTDLAGAVAKGTGTFTLDRSGDPAPYDQTLATVDISTSPGKAVISVDDDRLAMTITGEPSAMRVLADNILGVAKDSVPGEHLHIDYFPDHFYLAERSAALVVALAPETSTT